MHMYCADTECVQPSAKTACKSGTPPVAWGTLTASARTRRRRKGRVRRVRRRSGGVGELRLSFVFTIITNVRVVGPPERCVGSAVLARRPPCRRTRARWCRWCTHGRVKDRHRQTKKT